MWLVGLCARNVRYMTMEPSRRLFQSDHITLRNPPAGTGKISTLRLLQGSSLRPTLSPVEKLRQRKEPFQCDRNGLKLRGDYPMTTSGNIGRASQPATIPVLLRSRRKTGLTSLNLERSIQSRTSLRNGASVDQASLSENMETLDERGNGKFCEPRHSVRMKDPRSLHLAGKAWMRGYSSKRTEGSHGAMSSSRSTKASTNLQNGIQNYKDQPEPWQTQKKALSEKFGPTGWLPRKRLSPDTLEGIRVLHAQYPDRFTNSVLADQFKVSPEAIRRILKSKWRPTDEEEEMRRRRWEKRGESIWSQKVEMGIKPPKKWREMGVGKSIQSKASQSKHFESQMKSRSRSSSQRGQISTNLHTISVNGDEIGSSVLLADRIL